MPKVRRGVVRMAGTRPDGVPKSQVWRARLICPRCQRLCAAERCASGRYRIFCEKPGCKFVTCQERADGLGGESE